MELKIKTNKIWIDFKRNKDNPEKHITPTSIFVNLKNKAFGEQKRNGFIISIKFWDLVMDFWFVFD